MTTNEVLAQSQVEGKLLINMAKLFPVSRNIIRNSNWKLLTMRMKIG